MGRIYDVCCGDDLRLLDTYIPSFMTVNSGIQGVLRVLPQQFERLYIVGATDDWDLLCMPLRWPQVA
jgi:hypothetical protein